MSRKIFVDQVVHETVIELLQELRWIDMTRHPRTAVISQEQWKAAIDRRLLAEREARAAFIQHVILETDPCNEN